MFVEPARKWVIFDADNTLWRVEHLYDSARADLCALIGHDEESISAVDKFQRTRDIELKATYGYTACRFARSFEDTLLHFEPTATAERVRHVRSLALAVFEKPAAFVEQLDEVFERVKALGYKIAIITAGERWVQERRLSTFHLAEHVEQTAIVENKNAAVFANFAQANNIDASHSWVIGDSPLSDIHPAHAAGYRTILVQAENWTVENTPDALPNNTITVSQFKDILTLSVFAST